MTSLPPSSIGAAPQADIWYVARKSNYSAKKIEAVVVERHTESSVWIKGRKRAQQSTYDNYFPTWGAAHAMLMADAKEHVESCRSALERANSLLGNVKGMRAAIQRATGEQK